MSIVICGRGRLGSFIEQSLRQHDYRIRHARIDRAIGLLNDEEYAQQDIDTLLICMVPKANADNSASPWLDLLQGLAQQVKNQQRRIHRVLHISSTAVFEACSPGWCDSNTPVQACNERTRGLINAEHYVPRLAQHSCIVRLPGLVGPGYAHYDPLSSSLAQVRHAIDIRAAAVAITQKIVKGWQAHEIEIMTNGQLYFNQQQWPLEQCPLLDELLRHNRVFRPSTIATF